MSNCDRSIRTEREEEEEEEEEEKDVKGEGGKIGLRRMAEGGSMARLSKSASPMGGERREVDVGRGEERR